MDEHSWTVKIFQKEEVLPQNTCGKNNWKIENILHIEGNVSDHDGQTSESDCVCVDG